VQITMRTNGIRTVANANSAKFKNAQDCSTRMPCAHNSGTLNAVHANASPGKRAMVTLNGISKIAIAWSEHPHDYSVK